MSVIFANPAYEQRDNVNWTPDVTASVEAEMTFFGSCPCGWEGMSFDNPDRAEQEALWHTCPAPTSPNAPTEGDN